MHCVFHIAQGDLQIGQSDSHELGVVVYACDFCHLGRLRQEDRLTWEASLGYIVRSRVAWAT